MYIMSIENGVIDYNKVKEIRDSGYLMSDITNGVITTLEFIPNLKEVKEIINIVRKSAIEITVWKMVKLPNDKNLQKQLDSNNW